MMRRPIVLALLALLALLLLAPILVLLLATGPPTPSASADRGPGASLVADQMYWSIGTPIIPNDGGAPDSYSLQAGSLAAAEPVIDLEVRFITRVEEVSRIPAVSAPIDGRVVYVGDDGATSEVRVVRIDPAGVGNELIARLEPIVWDVVIDPASDTVYLAIAQRDGTDAGVVSLPLDGSAAPRPVIEAARIGAHTPPVRLAAFVIGSSVRLGVSLDGRHLVRATCRGSECATEVIDLASGATQPLGVRDPMGVADGRIYHRACMQVECWIMAIDFGVGREQEVMPIERDALLATARNRLVVVAEADVLPDGRALSIRAVGLAGGSAVEVFRAPDGGEVGLNVSTGIVGEAAITLPDGVILVDELTEDRSRLLAVSLDSGEWIEVAQPPEPPPFAGIMN